ncbi:VTT domain-containing protein [Clostridium rectalis]|uniref:VTT domain-containing protein n=1 Tax=Clostridium rectalis TaxID=2040295 RepID=UPI000F63D43B|nr:VTT domain-containing protein [Clostridium rectalis]
MNKKNKLIMFTILWLIVIGILYYTNVLTTDINKISTLIKGNPLKMKVIFVLLSTIRIMFFIPQTIFIIIGSIIFGPWVGFILSLLSLIISQSIIFFIGKNLNSSLLEDNFSLKQKNIINILKHYGYKILALGVICPITPSDLITFSAACIKLNYIKSIIVITIADIPIIFLYNFLLGETKVSYLFKLLTLLTIVFISYYSFLTWDKINKSVEI